MNSTDLPCLTVPLDGNAHRLAGQFAAEQMTPQKGTKTYLNTLAVYAVHNYLKWLQIETDLSQGDSWHSGLRCLFDVADLVLPSLGKLECRPVLPEETIIALPPEVSTDRVGYVAVQFGERLNQVRLLGFVSAVDIANTPEQIRIADLQPLDALLDSILSVVDQIPRLTGSQVWVNLSRWLQHSFEAGWQNVESLVSIDTNPTLSLRSAEQLRMGADTPVGVTAGKLIDLGMQLAGHPVVLLVTLAPEEEEVAIRLRVYPARRLYLPPNLQLRVVDESGVTCLEAQARCDDNWMQLELSGEPGERFSVKVTLGDVSVTEGFVI